MATRINTRFVMILFIVLFFVGGAGGGVWFIQYRRDATRNIIRGREYVSAGNLDKALDQFGRAVRKEPSIAEYVDLYESTLLQIRPDSSSRAVELDNMRIDILRLRVTYAPHDASKHIALLEELIDVARFTGQDSAWQSVIDTARDMDGQLAADDPLRIHTRLYRGLAQIHLAALQSDITEAIDTAATDLKAFLEHDPKSDLAWASLIRGRLSMHGQVKITGSPEAVKEAETRMHEAVAGAKAAVTDGPEVAMAVALVMAYERQGSIETLQKDDMVAAINHLVEQAEGVNDPLLLTDMVTLLRAADLETGRARAIEILEHYLQSNPEGLYHRFLLAQLRFQDEDLTLAERAVREVIESEPLRVSVLGRVQYLLQIRAASLLFDIEYRRWELATDDAKGDLMGRIEIARDQLASMLTEPQSEPLVLRAEGRVALARADYATAAAKFERTLDLGGLDFEVIWYAAHALERRGQIGSALDRMYEALAIRPKNLSTMLGVARLATRDGRLDEARAMLEAIEDISPGHPDAALVSSLVRLRHYGADDGVEDLIAAALRDSEDAFGRGDAESARRLLLDVLAVEPQNILILTRLTGIELREGRPEQARMYADKAHEIDPDNRYITSMWRLVNSDDQVEALTAYLSDVYPEGPERTVQTAVQLSRLADMLEAAAMRHDDAGSTEEATAARADSVLARDASETMLLEAEQIDADHPVLLEFRFGNALRRRDLEAAEKYVLRAREVDADLAGGFIFQGRYELARGDYAAAAQSLTEATRRKGYDALGWRLLGRAQERLGNLSDARIAYGRAYDRNGTDAIVVRWYVGLLMQMGEQASALTVLRETRARGVEDTALHELWLQMEAAEGDQMLALETRRGRYQRNPGERVNAMRLASLLGRAKPTRVDVIDDSGHEIYDTVMWSMLAVRERAEKLAAVQRAWRDEAQSIVDELERDGEPDLAIVSLKADLLRSQSRNDDAEMVLVAYLQSQTERENQLEVAIVLSHFQKSIGKTDKAITTLETARHTQDADRREIDRVLAGFYFDQSMWDDARKAFESLAEETDDRGLRLRVVDCLVRQGEYSAAEERLRGIVDAEGPDFSSEMLEATIARGLAVDLVDEAMPSEAQVYFALEASALERAERLQPESPLPHVQRARGMFADYVTNGDVTLLDDALVALDRADQARAGTMQASRVRFDVLRAMGDVDGAIGELIRMLERDPDDVDARRRLVRSYVQKREMQRAISVIAEAIELWPADAYWHEWKGELFLYSQEARQAVLSYRAAFELEPTPRRLNKLADATMLLTKPDFHEVIQVLVPDKQTLVGNPILRSLYARALDGLGRRQEAFDELRVSYGEFAELIEAEQMDPSERRAWYRSLSILHSDAETAEAFAREVAAERFDAHEFEWIAEFYIPLGSAGVTRARELQRQATTIVGDASPKRTADVWHKYGQYLLLPPADFAAAAGAFEEVIAHHPSHIEALNNLAYICAEYLADPQRALSHAEQAARLRSDDPHILDTLGWTHFKLGNLEEAERFLQQSVTIRPRPDVFLNLAKVLVAADRPEDAERALERALDLLPDPVPQELQPLRDQINELAEKIHRTQRGG